MRVLGVDYGRRRIGLAVSDASGALARPWKTIDAGASPVDSAGRIAAALDQARRETFDDFQVGAVVVGLPRRLNGDDTHGTGPARALATALAVRVGLPVHLQDERLSSHEADARLAEREPDWRVRKRQLDAAAAAIVLQDYLDHHPLSPAADSGVDLA